MSTPSSQLNELEYQSQTIIDTLNHDLPTLFEKDISYNIYTRDIYFKDPVNTFQGKFNYRIIFWTLRFHAKLFFTNIYFDVHDITQVDTNMIRVNWTVRGTLRVPWKATIFFNGYSLYTLNELGLIYNHQDTWDRQPSKILKQFFQRGNDQL